MFITITGLNHYYGKKPFKVGKLVIIRKEPDNGYDSEAIRVELPHIDTIGYVANSTNTVFDGTMSAGRIYDKIDEYAYAEVLFITHSSIIAIVVPPEKVENQEQSKTDETIIKQGNAVSTASETKINDIKTPIGFKG